MASTRPSCSIAARHASAANGGQSMLFFKSGERPLISSSRSRSTRSRWTRLRHRLRSRNSIPIGQIPSIVPQRYERIDAGGSPRRRGGCRQCHQKQTAGGAGHHPWIGRRPRREDPRADGRAATLPAHPRQNRQRRRAPPAGSTDRSTAPRFAPRASRGVRSRSFGARPRRRGRRSRWPRGSGR